MAVHIRRAQERDLDSLLGLLRQLTSRPDSGGASVPAHADAVITLRALLTRPGVELFVATESSGNGLLGTATLVVIPNLTHGGRPWSVIENVVVDSAHRREGIGAQLVGAAIDRARALGCYKVQLLSGTKDVQLAFYSSLGFDTASCMGHKLYFQLPTAPN